MRLLAAAAALLVMPSGAHALPWGLWLGAWKIESSDVAPRIERLRITEAGGALTLAYQTNVCFKDEGTCPWIAASATPYFLSPLERPEADPQAIIAEFTIKDETGDIKLTIVLDNLKINSFSAHVYSDFKSGMGYDSAWHRTFLREPEAGGT